MGRVVRQGCNVVQHLNEALVRASLVRSQQQRFPTRTRYCISHDASRPRSVTIPRKLRFILTSTAATMPMLPMSTSMFGCPLKYGNLHGISTTQSAMQFCD